MWQHHFEFLLLGYGAYATFAELCKAELPDIPDQHIAQMVAGIDVLLFRPDAELRRLAVLAIETEVDDAFIEGRTPAEIDAALAGIREELGPVTILVNAAGLDGFKRFAHIEFADWQRLIDVNLNGVFHMIQAVLPDMLDAEWGRIVNISSSSTHSGAPFMSHYVAAKSAVNGLTKSLALEYGPNGITVNAVPPGFIDTPMLRSAEKRGNLGDIDKTIAATPVRRIGKPEDIAAAVVAAARSHRGMSFAPRRLQLLLRTALLLPERPRRFVSRVTRTEQAYLAVDHATRDSYHARAVAAAAQSAPGEQPGA